MGQTDRDFARAKQQQFADILAENYQHHADLKAYAQARLRGAYAWDGGEMSRDWWEGLRLECHDAKHALYKIVRAARTLLGVAVHVHPANLDNGRRIYIQEFRDEGKE